MSATKAKKRLRPGELDGLVLAYMRKHKDDGPLTASAVGKGLGRSTGAAANCLARLAKAKKLRQVQLSRVPTPSRRRSRSDGADCGFSRAGCRPQGSTGCPHCGYPVTRLGPRETAGARWGRSR